MVKLMNFYMHIIMFACQKRMRLMMSASCAMRTRSIQSSNLANIPRCVRGVLVKPRDVPCAR